MKFESFGGGDANKKAHDSVSDATKKADPTTYSILPPEKVQTKIIRPLSEYSLPVRTAEGETYYELSGLHDPRGQQVVARMLKGILNVSDVVAVPATDGENKYYSWKLQHGKIEDENTREQMIAEQLLLQYLFNSKDHMFNKYSDWANNGRYDGGKLSHFDFGEDAYKFLETPTGRGSSIAQFMQMKPDTITYLKGKVSELESRFTGEEGKKFLQSIIDASPAHVTELFGPAEVFQKYSNINEVDLLHSVLVGRIEGLKKVLE
ncbi:MAG: hypothetical protein UU88_C0007G0020 [Parcubacteria group bacterium GW2011_GWC1_42_11]|uniref:Uncharacterized protein n=1 Tax=Candidatus Nomurabacteria bacterium GW2011_GWC2_42_20 TaxID=1618756 RepID=A0A0G0ZFG4_9BACT|nr:MAG: hypothetical protein UU88_C0007G0020 [Parcubacteria group bacterium GW2011_GWC1_42_11]KKS47480.1 MAG: hypothetical protein UV12_C0007G0020 [Candidatus Nomurabacteria bacterium GW2011_GWC2_42_20]KKS59141.1 MAG: hypothetical protein UV24_C0006G0011 [Candidatus Nomurabacteria bacterium GW2011_GWA2_42_41]KKT09499.1 MAG: hypothetical protein UV86_C0006G0014 [Candidatus Nomurabacteria bacterium GW2011_GWB1_43_20]HBH71349.1 hypothetical protein [Candidatus Yonathbacteria bacterium]